MSIAKQPDSVVDLFKIRNLVKLRVERFDCAYVIEHLFADLSELSFFLQILEIKRACDSPKSSCEKT